jgi:DNA-binding IclR family transcriptional regulator
MDDQGNSAEGDDDLKDRNFVTALSRGLDILCCFRPREVALSNLDFSERTGLPKPTISRLTYTLCQLGYLVNDPNTGTYRLGVGVLNLGFGVLSGMDICDRASDVLRSLRNSDNSYITAALGEAHRSDVIYVAVHRSREDVSLSMHVGSRLPLFRSAIGRAILVGLAEPDRDFIIEQSAKDLDVSKSELWEKYSAAKAEFDEKGYCSGFGEWRADVNGIAVPVRSLDSSRVYGLNVGGPSFHVSPEQLEREYSPRLIEAANFLSLKP